MGDFLLDTNVVSELVKPAPNQNVVTFLSRIEKAWLSIISFHELTYGLKLLPKGKRSAELEDKLHQLLSEYSEWIIPVNQAEANQAAVFRVAVKNQGGVIHLADALIAGTAKVNGLTVVTRNVDDFLGVNVEIVNPWE